MLCKIFSAFTCTRTTFLGYSRCNLLKLLHVSYFGSSSLCWIYNCSVCFAILDVFTPNHPGWERTLSPLFSFFFLTTQRNCMTQSTSLKILFPMQETKNRVLTLSVFLNIFHLAFSETVLLLSKVFMAEVQ